MDFFEYNAFRTKGFSIEFTGNEIFRIEVLIDSSCIYFVDHKHVRNVLIVTMFAHVQNAAVDLDEKCLFSIVRLASSF